MDKNKKAKIPPKDKFFGFFTGHGLSLRKNRLEFMYSCLNKYGDFLVMFLGKRRTILVNDHEAIKYVLLDNVKNYPKNTPGYQKVADVIGYGVFTDVGEEWKNGRKVIQPIFNPNKFDKYYLITKEESNIFTSFLDHNPNEVNISHLVTKYALHVIGRSLFNESLDQSFNLISNSLSHLIDLTESKMLALTPFVTPKKIKEKKKFTCYLKILDDEVKKLIQQERSKPFDANNLVHALYASPMNFSDEKILSQVKTMIFAGHETSANVMIWGFYYMLENPDYIEEVHQEIINKGDIESEEDLKSLKKLDLFLKEVMRLRPPAWSFGRIALEEDYIHGEKINKGDLVSLSPFLVHHNEKYFENPESFNPERFSYEIVPYSYIPFGAGQRICMGERLSYLEMRMLFYKVIKNYKLKSNQEIELNINAQVSLRPDKDLILSFIKR